MSQTYANLLGNPPTPLRRNRFFKWIADYSYRRERTCPIAQATSYYFAQAGADGNAGTQASPKKTLAAAQAIIVAAGATANIALYFNRGDVWEEATGLSEATHKANISVSPYGTGNKPLLNRFINKYTAAGWTNVAGNLWKRQETKDAGWVRYATHNLTLPFVRLSAGYTYEPPPPQPTLSTGAGSLAANTYFVRITYTTATGETLGSVEKSQAVGASGSLIITSPPAQGTATAWNAYVSTTTGTYTTGKQSTNTAIGTNVTVTTLATGTALPATSTASVVTPSTTTVVSGALAARTYFVKITFTTSTGGETTPSVEASQAVALNSVLKVNSPTQPSSLSITGYNVYISTTTNTETKQNGATPIAIGTPWQEPNTGAVVGAALPTLNTTLSNAVQNLGPSAANASPAYGGSWGYDWSAIDTNSAGVPTLYINVGASANTLNFEMVDSNGPGNPGIMLSGDGCRIHAMRCDGWGCHRSNTSPQSEGIQSQATGVACVVVTDSESYYSGSHAMTHYGTGSGGMVVFVRCKAGYTKFNGIPNESIYNAFSTSGGHEAFFVNCEATFGTLPSDDWTYLTRRRGQCGYGHANAGTISLLVWHNGQIPNNDFGAASGCAFSNLPTATTVSDVRGFVINETIYGGLGTGDGHYIGRDNHIMMSCDWSFVPPDIPSHVLTLDQLGGWMFNCNVLVDLKNIAAAGNIWAFSGPQAGQASTIQIYFCKFDIRNNSCAFGAYFDYSAWASSPGRSLKAYMYNSIVSNQGTGTGNIGFGNDQSDAASRLAANAYYNITASGTGGYNADTKAVVLTDPPTIYDWPTSSSPLYQTGTQLPNGLVVDYDLALRRRDLANPSIGPLSPMAGNLVVA